MISATRINLIAEVCHEANRAVQRHRGEVVNFPWESTSEALRESGRIGVRAALAGASPRELHESWLATKAAEGWVWGPIKDFAAKTHPQFVDYDALPETQKDKDQLFFAIVKGLS